MTKPLNLGGLSSQEIVERLNNAIMRGFPVMATDPPRLAAATFVENVVDAIAAMLNRTPDPFAPVIGENSPERQQAPATAQPQVTFAEAIKRQVPVTITIPFDSAHTLVAFGECACDLGGEPCIVCAARKALFALTGDKMYADEPVEPAPATDPADVLTLELEVQCRMTDAVDRETLDRDFNGSAFQYVRWLIAEEGLIGVIDSEVADDIVVMRAREVHP